MSKFTTFYILLAMVAIAHSEETKPFVEYSARSAPYLKQLHSRTGKGTLSYRHDYPGGVVAWQLAARKELQQLLGLDQIREDAADHRPVVRLDSVKAEDGYTRQRGEIETEPGVTIPFWLLRPDKKADKLRPLAICAHGHDWDRWNTYAGVYRNEAHRQKTLAKDGNPGVQAVRRGFIALVPATRGLAKVTEIPDPRNRHGGRTCRAQMIHCLLAGRTAVGERVWDTQRVLDWALDELKEIDPKRIIMMGNSGGGVLTVYAAALDTRITVAVPCCSFTSFTSATGFVFHCDCCLVPRIQTTFGDMADVGALTAPRALLAVHGRKDGLHSRSDVDKAMKRVQTIYDAANAPKRFSTKWGDEGHQFYPKLIWPFIESSLAQQDAATNADRPRR